jgi:hypothetical protein
MEHGLVNTAKATGIRCGEWPEYRLVIPAEDPVGGQVHEQRLQWQAIYGKDSISSKPPGITLACWWAREEMEETMIRWIGNLASQTPGFGVTLNNFSGLPPQLVYIRIQEAEPFRKIVRLLRPVLERVNDGEGQVRLFERPFIQLGKLPEENTRQWLLHTHQQFHAAFTAQQMVLYRHKGAETKKIGLFPFKTERSG